MLGNHPRPLYRELYARGCVTFLARLSITSNPLSPERIASISRQIVHLYWTTYFRVTQNYLSLKLLGKISHSLLYVVRKKKEWKISSLTVNQFTKCRCLGLILI